jgi:hypothetical protein
MILTLNLLLKLWQGRQARSTRPLITELPTMYAIRIAGKLQFLRNEGGYCDLTAPHEIRWFNHWITVTEYIQEIQERSLHLEAIESRDVLLLIADRLNKLSPEIMGIVSELEAKNLTDEELFAHIDMANRLAAMRGGMDEMRKKREDDAATIARLETEARQQREELERLMISMRDYEAIVLKKAE